MRSMFKVSRKGLYRVKAGTAIEEEEFHPCISFVH